MATSIHPSIPVVSPSFLYHPYIPSFQSKDFSFTCIHVHVYMLRISSHRMFFQYFVNSKSDFTTQVYICICTSYQTEGTACLKPLYYSNTHTFALLCTLNSSPILTNSFGSCNMSCSYLTSNNALWHARYPCYLLLINRMFLTSHNSKSVCANLSTKVNKHIISNRRMLRYYRYKISVLVYIVCIICIHKGDK